ncbi:MAG TPA: cupin [Dehalococcoidia bacterium]|nr:cupin [Dehalococcoidia bacterium]
MNDGSEQPRKVEKPWGYELIFAHTERYAGKLLYIKEGHRLSLQYHQKKDESIYVYQGELLLQMGGADGRLESVVLKAGDCKRIETLTRHRMQAVKDTILFEVSSPELDDVVRLDDDYGRTDKK